MNILAVYYGIFPEIENLYSRFSKGSQKLRIIVDVDNDFGSTRENFISLYHNLAQLMPSLRQHSCCEEWEAAPLYITEEESVSVKRIGEAADFPHLLEHLIVDMNCSVGKMKLCSGITCGWKDPENRFDLFIECDDPRIGVFAASFGIYLINNFLAGCPGENDYGLILKLASMIRHYPETKSEVARLAEALNESVENINRAIKQLSEFHFFLDPQEVSDEDNS